MSDLPPTNRPPGSASKAHTSNDTAECNALARTLASAERTIRSVLASPNMLLALAPSGYNELELNKGLTLVATAQAKFTARQETLAVATLAAEARAMAFDIARKEFAAYRAADQSQNGGASPSESMASRPVPSNHAAFCAVARAAYRHGLTEHAQWLSNSGFDQRRLTTALTVLDKLDAARGTHDLAMAKAAAATETRDVAVDALMSWLAKLRATATSAAKTHPTLLALLKD